MTQQLVQQLLPNEKIKSYYCHVIDSYTNRKICDIEDAYLDVIAHEDMQRNVTFGEVTDALEKYLKENYND